MRIVLIGAGLAAQRCAETLRANGHEGPIVMVGAEPHAPYDRPPLSKALLAGERPDLSLKPATWHGEHAVELRTGTKAVGLEDRSVRLDTGEALAFDRLLIATGARPVELPGLAGRANVHTLRTLDDALRLDEALATTQRLAIVGAGLIGQEVASAARARGVDATLIDAAPAPFDALMGSGAGHHLHALHANAGVDLRLGRRLLAVHGQTMIEALDLDDGTRIRADQVLMAVGVRPDTQWTPWPSGIPVDPAGRAPARHVYAAGDAAAPYDPIARRPLPSAHWEAAARQGAAAARAMLGLPERAEAPPLVWSDQHGVRIQRVGDTRHAELHDNDEDAVFTYTRAGRPAAVVLMNRPGALAAARRRLRTPIKEAA
jgi:NADPH-dependent 2,4-dienoyl-CoA reductase/sulfur reductase-like enzyme